MSEQWALLWHGWSDTLEVITVKKMLSHNLESHRNKRASMSDGIPLHIGTEQECREAAEACAGTLEGRAR